MLALLDYGAGNIRSVEKALHAAGAEVVRTASAADLDRARVRKGKLDGPSDEWLESFMETLQDALETVEEK